eukprot:m.220565 g.220565  ORF g.220565 m.220565 type:complete len:186 (-) comp54150_c0_seq1:1188-1745(-)
MEHEGETAAPRSAPETTAASMPETAPSSTSSGTGKRRKYAKYTQQDRQAIRQLFQEHGNAVYNLLPHIPRATKSGWILQGDRITSVGRQRYLDDKSERTIIEWIERSNEAGWFPQGPDILSFARSLYAKSHKLTLFDVKVQRLFSQGWLHQFLRRHPEVRQLASDQEAPTSISTQAHSQGISEDH